MSGKRLIGPDGKWLVNSAGKAMVTRADGTCPECCGGCNCCDHSHDYEVVFSGYTAVCLPEIVPGYSWKLNGSNIAFPGTYTAGIENLICGQPDAFYSEQRGYGYLENKLGYSDGACGTGETLDLTVGQCALFCREDNGGWKLNICVGDLSPYRYAVFAATIGFDVCASASFVVSNELASSGYGATPGSEWFDDSAGADWDWPTPSELEGIAATGGICTVTRV